MLEIVTITLSSLAVITTIINLILLRKDRKEDVSEALRKEFTALTEKFAISADEALKAHREKVDNEMCKLDTDIMRAGKDAQEIRYNYLNRFNALEGKMYEGFKELVVQMNQGFTSLRTAIEDGQLKLLEYVHKGD